MKRLARAVEGDINMCALKIMRYEEGEGPLLLHS